MLSSRLVRVCSAITVALFALQISPASARHWPGLVPGSAGATGEGCANRTIDVSQLQNNQVVGFEGGPCGGWIVGEITFSGVRSHNGNTDDSHQTNAGLSVEGICQKSDHHFDSFTLTCPVRVGVWPYSRRNIRVNYSTETVNDNPLPTLRINLRYNPGQPPDDVPMN